MAAEHENTSKVLSVLSHKIRREILLILHDKGESSFTDLMNTLHIDTGKLSFHMRSLQPFIEQTKSGKYKLNRIGENAVRIIRDVESWAEIADASRKDAQLQLASFGKRMGAFLIDFAITFSISTLLLFELVASSFTSNGNLVVAGLNLLFVALGLLWVYSTLLEGFGGQSVGKRALSIMVVRTNGRKVDYEHAAVRNFGKVLLPLDLVFGYILKDKRYIRYFDKFAGTTVIDLRKRGAVPTPDPTETVEEKPLSELKT
jgi:uncharacterized RDD family membrane protein YckC